MAQLGFTFYPKDWWTSDSFFNLQPFERYIYLELLFMMYSNDGFIANKKVMIESRLRTTIKEEVWVKITDLFVKDGDKLTHISVNKRLKKAISNRENGKKGGRPKEPKKPKKETQINPPLEKEEEREKEDINDVREINFQTPYADVQRFIRPTLDDVKMYFKQMSKKEESATKFYNYYDGLDWMKGNSRIYNWRSFALNWEDAADSTNKQKIPDDKFNKEIFGK